MPTLDPATGRPLPDSAIQRVLFVTTGVHVYQIPPLTSNKGFSASAWTSPTQPTAQQIFTARMRVIETSIGAKIKADVVLEDAQTGDLFAAAPYTSTAIVQQALDSSRFFAVRVQGEGGMKATLGIGFEDRSPAFDFGVALGEVRKILAAEGASASARPRDAPTKSNSNLDIKKDFSLKEGETIQIHVGSKGRRPAPSNTSIEPNDDTALFSIAPPPSSAKASGSFPNNAVPPPPPPPVATAAAASATANKSAQDLGFDDGEFGEFQ